MLPDFRESLAMQVPPELQESVARHQENLLRLMENLRAAGMEDAQIEAALTTLIDSYKRELMEAIRALRRRDEGKGP